ncbi:CPBP family intramembrane glutamic endopeptidase [Stakelama tenebrarum]|uniref:CPBP family intramembrane metalloprotease n=1 Tax=Stakelama tenebrarum TaxID=2711215 RepID=A0A6G6Y2P0_9SPHN|nr:type II CAAX endopeptidase family protein [Sphingosinithalassobacter tenebrarum]QIG79111.1 CPBP family intramembrane metalloprotease [Sphingosinithalassobacter tenebrarum]
MTLALLDHLFVIIVLLLIFPVVGWWSYQRFKKQALRIGEPALLREYRLTLVWLGALLAATVALWVDMGRALTGLVTREPIWGLDSLATGLAVGMGAMILVRPLWIAASRKMADQFAQAVGDLALFLPKSGRALRWGLLVSVAAGVAEEIAYRGYLLPYFEAMLPAWAAIAASSMLFGLAHAYQGAGGVVVTGLLGAIFGVIFVTTGSLLLPVLLHALVDVSSMITAYLALRNRPEATAATANA